MNQLNLIVLEANACRNPVIKTTDFGTTICKMSVAVNRFYKSEDGFEKEVSFFDVDAFNDVAKLCGQKVKKGDEIRITGRLKQNRWTQDGINRSAVIVVAEHVEFKLKDKDAGTAASGPAEPPADTENIPF